MSELFGSTRPDDYIENPDYQPTGRPVKGRTGNEKRKVDHSKRTREFWNKQGYRLDRIEGLQSIKGAIVKKDFVGCFDFLATKPGETPVLVQVSSKAHVRPHLRKMLSQEPHDGQEPRRAAMDYFRITLGWRCVIHWWDQPAGFGKSWVCGIEEIDDQLVESIDQNRRTKRGKAA